MKLIENILGIVCIIAAIYNFDFYDLNRSIVSALLFMTGVRTLSRNEKLNEVLKNVSIGLAVFLIMKILISG